MDTTMIEFLKAVGYPIGSIITIVILAYLARQFFQKLLESVVAKDLEALKNQNIKNLENVRNEHNLILENRKSELAQETERLKAVLSVEAETHRLAAQKRFEVLLDLWQSTETLIQSTDFSVADSIQSSLSKVDESLAHLRNCSVLLSQELLEAVKIYLEETLKVLTSPEEEIQNKSIDEKKSKLISEIAINAMSMSMSMSIPVVGSLYSMLVPSMDKMLEKLRYARAEKARVNLEKVIRKEFGVQNDKFLTEDEKGANKAN